MKKKANYIQGNASGGLSPITSPWMHRLLDRQETAQALIAKYGSPMNIHHLPTFAKTIASFKTIFDSYGLKYQIFYARKANKCKSLVKQAFASGIGVDTASLRELEQSLQLGGTSDTLVLTSAIKTEEQLVLAIKNDVPIILDNFDECMKVDAIASDLGKIADIGIRVSGFLIDGEKLYSRFGFDVEKVETYIMSYLGSDKAFDNLSLSGFHFHLDGYSTVQRAKALSDCIDLTERLRLKGYPIRFVDIGGGILMNYLESEEQWNDFDAKLRANVMENSSDVTFNGSGLGYEMVGNTLHGYLKTYPYFNNLHGEDFLREILDFSHPQTLKSNSARLIEEKIELRIEPGRSLLNQTGMTVAKVIHRKQDSRGQWLVGLEMNMNQMMSSSADYLLDPYVLYSKEFETNESVDVLFTGAYCLERDILLKRKIELPKLPEIGDLVAFVNTAGYMMHFFETEAHLFELSKNLSYIGTEEPPSMADFIDDELINHPSEVFQT